eukprot:jgi/Mesen1/1876/ME000143S00929
MACFGLGGAAQQPAMGGEFSTRPDASSACDLLGQAFGFLGSLLQNDWAEKQLDSKEKALRQQAIAHHLDGGRKARGGTRTCLMLTLVWANFLGGCPDRERAQVMDMLFDEKTGLGFNIARYNIGGGHSALIDTQYKDPPKSFLALPGYKPSEAGGYDWSADANQRRILLEARARGADVFEAFSYSAPWWMTVSGSVAGAYAWGQENLKRQYYAQFADYLAEVVRRFKEDPAMGHVEFQTLEPFNEPVEGWWIRGGRQEGCNFRAESMAEVVKQCARALEAKGMGAVKVAGVDAWVDNTPGPLEKFDEDAKRALHQINVHSYFKREPWQGDNVGERKRAEARRAVRQLADRLGKKVWQTEWGPMGFKITSELDIALRMARDITADVNQMHAAAWMYWQALEQPNGGFWGLLFADFTYDKPLSVTTMKQYHVLMNFTRNVPS